MGSPSLSLWAIEDGLAELLIARQELVEERELAEGAPVANRPLSEIGEDLAAVEKTLAEYMGLEPRKADNYHRFISGAGVTIAALKLEEAAIARRRKRLEMAVDDLKGRALEVMVAFDKKRLEGTNGRYLLRKGNGGLEPVHVDGWDDGKKCWTAPEVVPDAFVNVSVTIPAHVWRELTKSGFGSAFLLAGLPVVREPSKTRLRAALVEPCGACDGTGVADDAEMKQQICPACHGSKRSQVPGARLMPRGQHIELK